MRGAFTFEGKRYYVSGKDKVEVEVKKAIRLKELEEGKVIESNMLFRDWSNEWLETYKMGACGDKTYSDYIIYILPEIGHMRLKDIKPEHIQRIMQNVKGMSQSRIDKIHQCICQIFEAAENNDLIVKSPVKGIMKPKGTSGSHRAITKEEREAILKTAETHKHGLWIKVMLFCGLRPGETARIKVCHFDFEKKLLFVDGTKTNNAQRFVPVPDEILQAVRRLKKSPFEYVFLNERKDPLQKHNMRRMWGSFRRSMHIEMWLSS